MNASSERFAWNECTRKRYWYLHNSSTRKCVPSHVCLGWRSVVIVYHLFQFRKICSLDTGLFLSILKQDVGGETTDLNKDIQKVFQIFLVNVANGNGRCSSPFHQLRFRGLAWTYVNILIIMRSLRTFSENSLPVLRVTQIEQQALTTPSSTECNNTTFAVLIEKIRQFVRIFKLGKSHSYATSFVDWFSFFMAFSISATVTRVWYGTQNEKDILLLLGNLNERMRALLHITCLWYP